MSTVANRAVEPVLLELSQAHVDQVVRSALGAGNMTLLLSGLSGVANLLQGAPKQLDDGRLSRSLLLGLLLPAAFPKDGG
jgi:hypothetical protein